MGSEHISPAPNLRRIQLELLPPVRMVADTTPSPTALSSFLPPPASSSLLGSSLHSSGLCQSAAVVLFGFPSPQHLSFQAVLALMTYPARVIKIDYRLRRKGSLSNLHPKTNWIHFA